MADHAFEDLDPDYAAALADRANGLMAEHGVPRTPGNFSVWFNYARGASPDLKRAIDAVIADGRSFDGATNRELASIDAASSSPSKVIGDIPEQLKSVMSAAKRYVTAAIADNRDQITAFDKTKEEAESGVDPRLLVAGLMRELTRAATRAAELEANLGQTSHELDNIREALIEAEKRASNDPLTGLPNRRAIDESLRLCQAKATENKTPLGVLLLDIDRFRPFNEKYGHGVGDQLLRFISGALRERLREEDLPARYGGEEFMAVLPGAELATCEAVAERIRRSISECRITRRSTGEMLPALTVSIGVAQFRPGETTAEFVDRCDRALQLAKRIGRNRVVTEVRVEGRSAFHAPPRDLGAAELAATK
jgi:diguanylate cyclase